MTALRILTSLSVLCLVFPTQVLGRVGPTLPRPEDPFADPANDPYNPLRYIASNVLTGIAFALVIIVALAQTWCMRKWGAKWMLSMTIGAYTFALGIAMRFGLAVNPEGKGIYIVEYLFVVLSPCAFIAANYVLLGRLAKYLDGDKYLLVQPRRITIVFISSDITTFLIQAAGGALSISANDRHAALTGSRIFLGGLALQLLSFFVFICVFLVFMFRIYKHEQATVIKDRELPWYSDWRSLCGAFLISCIGILIRSIYRTIELSEGFLGHLATTESYFYIFDTLPLFVAIAIYVPFWPGRYIPTPEPACESSDGKSDDEKV